MEIWSQEFGQVRIVIAIVVIVIVAVVVIVVVVAIVNVLVACFGGESAGTTMRLATSDHEV